jgi:predicted HTH transcriptional regulator
MGPRSLSQLIQSGESQTVEFKQSLSLIKEGLQSLCGMVNADSADGMVIFGLKSDGALLGVEPGDLDKAQRSIAQLVSSKFEPPLAVEILIEEVEGRRLLALSAQRGRGTPYYEYDGRGFIRIGSVTRVMAMAEKHALSQHRNRDLHHGPWQCDRCGSWIGLMISGPGPRSYACSCGGELWPAT